MTLLHFLQYFFIFFCSKCWVKDTAYNDEFVPSDGGINLAIGTVENSGICKRSDEWWVAHSACCEGFVPSDAGDGSSISTVEISGSLMDAFGQYC